MARGYFIQSLLIPSASPPLSLQLSLLRWCFRLLNEPYFLKIGSVCVFSIGFLILVCSVNSLTLLYHLKPYFL